MNAKDIKPDRLFPDMHRVFNAEECMAEGGVAVDTKGNQHRVICIDRDHPRHSIVTLIRNEEVESTRFFTKDGGANIALDGFRLTHPAKFDPQGVPTNIPLPPEKEGYKTVPRGYGWSGKAEYGYAIYSNTDSNPRWISLPGHGEGYSPRGIETTLYVEYVKEEPEMDANGFPTNIPLPPEKEGYKAVPRGYGWVGKAEHVYAYYINQWYSSYEGYIPSGVEGTFYVEYVKLPVIQDADYWRERHDDVISRIQATIAVALDDLRKRP